MESTPRRSTWRHPPAENFAKREPWSKHQRRGFERGKPVAQRGKKKLRRRRRASQGKMENFNVSTYTTLDGMPKLVIAVQTNLAGLTLLTVKMTEERYLVLIRLKGAQLGKFQHYNRTEHIVPGLPFLVLFIRNDFSMEKNI